MFETTVRAGVCQFRRPDTRWLSTGYAGGESRGSVAYNVSVPEGWPETNLDRYVDERLLDAGFKQSGPTLLTGVDLEHARRARLGSVDAVVTAGLSNPASLPLDSSESARFGSETRCSAAASPAAESESTDDRPPLGTINVVVGTERALAPGALANLLTVVAEAKAATLHALAGFTGTTSDAVVVACDPDGDPAQFSGSATPVGGAARACVRDALLAAIDARYGAPDATVPSSVAEATYGVVTDDHASVSEL